ncbi:unnamed protein product, partial [Effrenium voratum]
GVEDVVSEAEMQRMAVQVGAAAAASLMKSEGEPVTDEAGVSSKPAAVAAAAPAFSGKRKSSQAMLPDSATLQELVRGTSESSSSLADMADVTQKRAASDEANAGESPKHRRAGNVAQLWDMEQSIRAIHEDHDFDAFPDWDESAISDLMLDDRNLDEEIPEEHTTFEWSLDPPSLPEEEVDLLDLQSERIEVSRLVKTNVLRPIDSEAAAHFPQLSTRFVKVWKLKEKWYRRARLVARQYKWATDMALWETFSPASTSAGVRLLIVASQLMQTPIFTADVRDAYLNVPQPEDQPVAISSPKSWGDPPQYWQLMKYLPGQRAERVQCRDISVRAIGTVFNPSDVGTKVLSVQRLRLLCYIMGIRDSGDNPVGFAEYEMAVYDRIAKRAQQVIACKSSKALTATLFAILARGSEGADMIEKEADVQSDSFFIGICMIVGFALFGFYTFCVKLFQYLQQMCEKRRLRLMDQMPEETVDFSRSKEMEMYVNMVLVTPNGRHYHTSHCKWLDGRSTTRVHESDAVAAHYKKCHTCFSLRVVTKRSKRHGAAASSASAE